MAQFKAYENTSKASKKLYPYLLDIQSNLLEDLRTTIVIPLCSMHFAEKAAICKLCPILEVKGELFVALTQQMAGINKSALGKEACDLSHYRAEIINALDFIISGI